MGLNRLGDVSERQSIPWLSEAPTVNDELPHVACSQPAADLVGVHSANEVGRATVLKTVQSVSHAAPERGPVCWLNPRTVGQDPPDPACATFFRRSAADLAAKMRLRGGDVNPQQGVPTGRVGLRARGVVRAGTPRELLRLPR
jgi:hypothetical protein